MRRLLSDQPLNGEIELLSGVNKAMATYLAGIPLEGRQAAWDAMLALRSDRDAIIIALAAVDPSGPAPAAPNVDRHTWETWQRPGVLAVSSG